MIDDSQNDPSDEPRRVELSADQVASLLPGPIRRPELEPTLTEWARSLFARIGYLTTGSFEKWEFDFLREMNPAGELGLWEIMARALAAHLAAHPAADPHHAMTELNAISLGARFEHETSEIAEFRSRYSSARSTFETELQTYHLKTLDAVARHCVERAAS